ncbi:MAG TPA: hypothetical protein VL306_01420 [Methylomirabilota bacterium]|nr:hypothetical protein [Methylomirabilota bacterium]
MAELGNPQSAGLLFGPTHTIRNFLVTGLCIVLLISGTFVYAQTANPGDTLFPLNKFSEQVALSLPLSIQTKARIHSSIVARRFNALTQIIAHDHEDDPAVQKLQVEIVKESDDTLTQAVKAVASTRKYLKDSGDDQDAAQLSNTLKEIQELAQKHEQSIEDLETKIHNPETRAAIETHRQAINNTRTLLSAELNAETKTDLKKD